MTATIETLTGAAAEAVSGESAFGPRPRISEAMISEAQTLLGGAFKGNRRALLQLQEALSTSDFQAAVFDVLDRETLARYEDIVPVWRQYVSTTTVRDFRAKRLVDLLGGKAALDPVPELGEYPARSISKALYRITVRKYGGRFALSWEAMINDDIDELRDLPGSLAAAARDTESRAAASLLTDGDGPNTTYFNATAWGRTYDEDDDSWSGGESNLLASNPVLSTDNLEAALNAIQQRKDSEGRPIVVNGYVLVVPPALEFTARRILEAREIRITTGSTEVIYNNYVAGRVRLVVDPWLGVLDTGTNADTSWWILPDPAASRKALFIASLRGHEAPELRVKADTGQRVGGGNIPAEEGSFDIDDIQYRVRHVIGTAGTDMIASAFSNGSGS